MYTHQFHEYVYEQSRQLKLKWRVMEFKEEAAGTLCLDVYQNDRLQQCGSVNKVDKSLSRFAPVIRSFSPSDGAHLLHPVFKLTDGTSS
ncbi:hypothetical protein, partial [Alkalicoccus luteus]